MTTTTIRLERRVLPVHNLGIALMTFGALKIVAVILRLIRQARVAVISGRPCIRRVAQTTVLRGIEVPWIHAGSLRAVVAGRTGAQDLVVVDCRHRRPDGAAVAVLADVGCLHMRGALAGRVGAIVTAEAIVDDVGMVEVRGCPCNGRMAVITVIATGDVGRVFAGRLDAVMAGTASAQDLCVVHRKHRRPDVRSVAVLANVAGLDVRRSLARGIGAVMATDTVTRDVDVIEVGR